MINDPKKIIQFIRSKSDHPMKMKELAKALSIKSSQYAKFRNVIKALIESGELVKLKRSRIGLADEMNVRVGKLSVTRGGAGYLICENEEVDTFISNSKLGVALDGDTVMVRLIGYYNDQPAGVVIKVVERAQRNIVGIYKKGRNFAVVIPDNKKIHRDIYIPEAESLEAKDGEKVVINITEWEDPYHNPEGKITERLGFPGQPGVDMLTIIKTYNFPQVFPDEVISDAEVASAKLGGEEFARREDLSDEPVYTIDPFDAKDHDDAVSVVKTDKGYTLGVHIADVAHYVEEGSELDKEAFKRGNSVYLPGTVIPMLPEILSNETCSLKPNRKRLAFSVIIDFDEKGKMLKWRIAETVIKSKAKLSYEEVQEYFDSGEVTDKIKQVKTNLNHARTLAKLLNQQRFKEGSLDFDLPEAKLIMNQKGEVLELGSKIRLESHRLVEEFMLIANQAVALEVFRKAQPFIYRVHDKPDFDRLQAFAALVKPIGYSFPVSKNMQPVQFARFLHEIKDSPESDFINDLLLRSMKKAVYQRENIGHFGLAFKHYTHFTSPIRRYPDLLVHRLLRLLKNGRYPLKVAKKVPSIIDLVGAHCSETERVAEAAEREAIKLKQMSFMAKHIGNHYSGVISGVTGYGFFVRLDNMGVEGMVRMSTIDDDYYAFDEKNYRIIGKRTGKVYRLSDKIKVGVLTVDVASAQMDLYVVDEKKKTAKKTTTAKQTTTPKDNTSPKKTFGRKKKINKKKRI